LMYLDYNTDQIHRYSINLKSILLFIFMAGGSKIIHRLSLIVIILY
jgi:hypothetical protein